MVGRVGDSKCDAILCPKGYFASSGRQALEDRPCQICEVPDAAQFMGSTTCFENSEREVLGKLYENTSGPQWMNSTLWMSDAPICSWFGIKCQGDEVDDKGIVLIDLPSNGLIGSVPAEVWEMPYIRELNLNDNPELFVSFESLHKPVFNLESLHIARSGNATLAGVSNFRNLRNLTLTGLAGKSELDNKIGCPISCDAI